MNSEITAVSHVQLAISMTDYLEPHINIQDKEPSWDGDVEVYRKPGDRHPKEDLVQKVPVQIKGIKMDNLNKPIISFPVEYVDMQNYLAMGGTVYIVVYVNDTGGKHIYYAELLPYNLKRILKEHEGKTTKTKNLRMKSFPTDKEELSNLFLSFARDMIKQKAAISCPEITIEELAKKGQLQELTFGYSSVPKKGAMPLDYFFDHGVYIYAKTPIGIELPVQHMECIDEARTTINANVCVNGKEFYDKYDVIYKKDIIEICFGKSSKLTIKRDGVSEQKFEFSLSGGLSERIRDQEFIIEAIDAKQFEIANTVFPFNKFAEKEIESFRVKQRKEHLALLYSVKLLLDTLAVKQDLDCTLISEADDRTIELLKAAVIDGKAISLSPPVNPLAYANVANLKILVYIRKSEEEKDKFYVCGFNEAKPDLTIKFEDGVKCKTSHYTLLKKEDILKCSNIDYDKMMKDIKSIEISDRYVEQVIYLLLEMLKAYDECETRKEDILNAIIELSSWLKNIDTYEAQDVLIINYYQSIKRKRKLEACERRELMNIIESSQGKNEMYLAASYLLLDDQEAANIHFNLLNEEEKKIFKEYPIYHFYKENN